MHKTLSPGKAGGKGLTCLAEQEDAHVQCHVRLEVIQAKAPFTDQKGAELQPLVHPELETLGLL